eukprot:5571186-Lingulodinium_polyedra.AAC.1
MIPSTRGVCYSRSCVWGWPGNLAGILVVRSLAKVLGILLECPAGQDLAGSDEVMRQPMKDLVNRLLDMNPFGPEADQAASTCQDPGLRTAVEGAMKAL